MNSRRTKGQAKKKDAQFNALRLGVLCAVINPQGEVLLSRRGDLNVWGLPGGRLDLGESLEACAVREVWEETGIEAKFIAFRGLYYLPEWRRMNILCVLYPIGGKLADKTEETRENRYFSQKELPKNTFFVDTINAALRDQAERLPPQTLSIDRRAWVNLRLKFAWRWMVNLLRGRPEPRYPIFKISAAVMLFNRKRDRIFVFPSRDGFGYQLPRRNAHGESSLWDQLGLAVSQTCGASPSLQWAGVWQDPSRNKLEFVFVGMMPERENDSAGQWVTLNSGLTDHDARYIEQMTHAENQLIWSLIENDELRGGDILVQKKGRKK